MPYRRLVPAFAASLLLHAALLAGGRPPPPERPSALHATLRPPVEAPAPVEPLVKNTLDEESERPLAPPPEPVPRSAEKPAAAPAKAAPRQVRAAQRKLAEHLYYPPEAIARGLEGEVRLILALAADGGIDDVQLAASSGHAILDDAAIRAAFAMGRLPGVGVRELILPVIFRLQ
ncbi:MAG: energy transducer TonB [Rhodocyclaceae bacterium]|nr:energy transducer TonB [Rhodocyclaceae bacterium]